MADLWFLLANLAFFLVVAMIYFIPTWIAIRRRHRRSTTLLAVNVLAGWTVAGWFAALAWALLGDNGKPGDAKTETR